jgi:N-acetyl sugar amidotransferase
VKYCANCILPDTRPNLEIEADGICNACHSFGDRREIDWEARRRAFQDVVTHAKSRSRGYDCLIPVSGGKDSTWQVVTCLEHGLNPLAVTWKTPGRTELGQQNLDNLVSLGVDHIDYQVNPSVEKRFMLRALETYGSTAIPMHMALFAIPLTIAVRFEIPLVVWGENSAFEYGGTKESRTGFRLDSRWLTRYGVTHGTTAEHWVGGDFTRGELTPYFGPGDEELESAGVNAVFLGYYFPWDVETSLHVARKNGFRGRDAGPRTGIYDYADIDDDFISIHHWLKWYKFGFTRTWDNLSLEIRNGRRSRDEAIELLRQRGDETPHEDIAKFCQFTGIEVQLFFKLCESWRNYEIWHKDGVDWHISDFLVPDWEWSQSGPLLARQ